MRITTIIAAGVLAATALPVLAATGITIQPLRDGDAGAVNACTGTAGGLTDRPCLDGRFIGTDFGTTTNLAVALSIANSTGPEQWARFSDAGGLREISVTNAVNNIWTFTPTTGFEVRVVGFEHRSRNFTGPQIPTYSLVDLGTSATLWNLTSPSLTLGMTAVNVDSAWSAAGLRFTWSNQGVGSLGLRNMMLEIREAAAPPPPPIGGVPEPACWAMLIAGFGLVGAASRRRRATVAA